VSGHPDAAVAAQLREVREQLLEDAAKTGISAASVTEAIERATAEFAGASVHSFIGILVERAVRERLSLPARSRR
jgi:hypothetical protein